MAEYFTDIIEEDWSNGLYNTEIDPDVFTYSSPTRTAIGRSSFLGEIKKRHTVVFYNDILQVPHLDALTPDSAPQGSPDTVVMLDGSFIEGDVAYWNGTTLPTTFIDPHTLQVTISAALLAGDCGAISVANQAGSWSNSLAFDVGGGGGIVIF